jgi:hypothetical protein
MPAGRHLISWDAGISRDEPYAEGLYFCKMETERFIKVIKLVRIN